MLRILVPVDLSESSVIACKYALSLCSDNTNADNTNAIVVLLHCYQDYLDEQEANGFAADSLLASELITDNVLNRNRTEAQDKLDELYHTLKAANRYIQLERVFMYGPPDSCIPEEVQRFKPDLVVMATKGDTGLASSFFGTVSTNIAQEVKVPVLTIPENYEGTSIKRVVYATDFDKADTVTLTKLQRFLHPFNAVIECVHVSDEPSGSDKEKLKALREQLQQTATSNLTYTLLDGDDVAGALQKFVAEQAIDLIAVTNRSRTLLGSLLNPSLTKKLVLESQVPLFIFHAPE